MACGLIVTCSSCTLHCSYIANYILYDVDHLIAAEETVEAKQNAAEESATSRKVAYFWLTLLMPFCRNCVVIYDIVNCNFFFIFHCYRVAAEFCV